MSEYLQLDNGYSRCQSSGGGHTATPATYAFDVAHQQNVLAVRREGRPTDLIRLLCRERILPLFTVTISQSALLPCEDRVWSWHNYQPLIKLLLISFVSNKKRFDWIKLSRISCTVTSEGETDCGREVSE